MQIIGAVLAIAGVVAALPGGGDGGYPYGGGDNCHTSSTCKASYFTTTKNVPYKETKTVTKTEYKPSVYTTNVHKAYTTTAYGATARVIQIEVYTDTAQFLRNIPTPRPFQSRRLSLFQITQPP